MQTVDFDNSLTIDRGNHDIEDHWTITMAANNSF